MTDADDLSGLLLGELAQILRPILGGLLDAGVPYQAVDEVVRRVFVEAAMRQGGADGTNDSRISVATGLARREVKRLRELIATTDKHVPESVSLGGRIVAAWLATLGYQDEEGMPLPIPHHAESSSVSFDALVRSVSQDIRSRAVLDEWLRLGVASVSAEDVVTLNSAAFVPAPGSREKAFYLGHNLHDHAAAAMQNFLGAHSTPWLERCVHYNGLTPEEIGQIRKLAEQLGARSLNKLNQHVQGLPKPEANIAQPQRFTFGVYFYAEPQADVGSNAKEDK